MMVASRITSRRALICASGLLVGVLACRGPAADRQDTPTASREALAPFVGKTWISTDPSAAPGTFRIFLPDGTLVMDSCVETYRLAHWQATDDGRIKWQEDAAQIEAEVAQVSSDQLQLRLHLVREVKEENYRLAQVPFVCPDARPNQATSALTPSPTIYRCGNETFSVAFEDQRAHVTIQATNHAARMRRMRACEVSGRLVWAGQATPTTPTPP